MAGKFCDPDVHAKNIVEIGKVFNHFLRISAVMVRSHVIPLVKKFETI